MHPAKSAQLSSEDEQALVAQWKADQDTVALGRLIDAHRPALEWLAREQSFGDTERAADLFQDAILLFVESLAGFDPARGCRLGTYVQRRVGMNLLKPARESVSVVKPARIKGKWETRIDASLCHDDGTDIDPSSLSSGARRVPAMTNRDEADGDGSGGMALHAEICGGPGAFDDRAGMLDDALESGVLTERERRIFDARHGQGETATRSALAGELGISETRVRQIESAAIGKIAAHVRSQQASIEARTAAVEAAQAALDDAKIPVSAAPMSER